MSKWSNRPSGSCTLCAHRGNESARRSRAGHGLAPNPRSLIDRDPAGHHCPRAHGFATGGTAGTPALARSRGPPDRRGRRVPGGARLRVQTRRRSVRRARLRAVSSAQRRRPGGGLCPRRDRGDAIRSGRAHGQSARPQHLVTVDRNRADEPCSRSVEGRLCAGPLAGRRGRASRATRPRGMCRRWSECEIRNPMVVLAVTLTDQLAFESTGKVELLDEGVSRPPRCGRASRHRVDGDRLLTEDRRRTWRKTSI